MNAWKTAVAPLEGDVVITPRVRDDVGGWAR